MYVKSSSKGVGPIPYEKRLVLYAIFNCLRFVRGGTSRNPNIHTYMLSIHTYMHTYMHAYIHTEEEVQANIPIYIYISLDLLLLLSMYVCMYVWMHGCMYVC